jgi:annexin D
MASAAGSEEACREIRGTCGAPRRLGLLLAPRSPAERQQIRAAYRARFGEDLAATLHGTLAAPNTNQVDEVKPTDQSQAHGERFNLNSLLPLLQLSKLLYLWALEPAERDAVVAREAVEGGVTAAGYRALVEVFTRRKQDQLFFTKQAYAARFRRSLDQDMATEPSHPYHRARARPSFLFRFFSSLRRSWRQTT